MKKKNICAALIVAILSIASAGAQQQWSLRQCIDYAVENNIAVKQQSIAVENAQIDLNSAQNSRLPDFNLGAGQSFSWGTLRNSAGAYDCNDYASTSLSAQSSMPLFTGFRIANQIKAKQWDMKAATEGLQRAQDDLSLQVAAAFLDVLFKQEILKVYSEQVTLSQQQEEQTSALVEAGAAPRSQLYDMKAKLAQNRSDLTSAQNALDLSILSLCQLMNLNDASGFDIEIPNADNLLSDASASLMTPQQVYEKALQTRPQIRQAEYRIESSRSELLVARADLYPAIDLQASVNTGYQYFFSGSNASFIDQIGHPGATIGISLSLPVFNRYQTRNAIKKAQLNIRETELQRDNVRLELYKEIQQAYQNATAAQSKFTSTQTATEASEEAFKYAQERYKNGKASVYELNEAQTKLLASRSEQVQAKYDFVFRSKILDFYSGNPLTL